VPDSVKTGVVVSDVETNGKAYDAGIRSGDVLVELGGTPVTSPQQLKELWQKSSGVVAALIARDGRTLFLTIEH
jgi:serine protease Do